MDGPLKNHNYRFAVIYVKVDQLRENPRNPRTHSKTQIRQLQASISEFGFTTPILIDAQNMIAAGHARLKAAMALGYRDVPCIRLDHLSRAQIRALSIADNKIAENADWDFSILAEELSDITANCPDLDLDALGFSLPEIDTILADAIKELEFDPHQKDPPSGMSLIQDPCPGDIWQQGNHWMMCVHERDRALVVALSGEDSTPITIGDPPKIVTITQKSGSKHARKRRRHAVENDAPVLIACGWPNPSSNQGKLHD